MNKISEHFFWDWKSIRRTFFVFIILALGIFYVFFYPDWKRNNKAKNFSESTEAILIEVKSNETISMTEVGNQIIVHSYEVKEKGYILYAIRIPENNKPYLSGKEIKNATTGYDENSGEITIDIELTYRGRDKWAEMTSMNISRMIALTLDSKVIFAPIVNNSISNGRTQISGNLTFDYANNVVERINAFSELNQKR
jgi:preprotein translocase subunit SecD